MSTQVDDAAILGLRAQILGEHSISSKRIKATTDILLVDNLRQIRYDTKDPTLATAYHSQGWIAIALDKAGYPICSTRGGDETLLDALRNMLIHTSKRIGTIFVSEFLREFELHAGTTPEGIDYKVSPILQGKSQGDVLIASTVICHTMPRTTMYRKAHHNM
jgi:hypothetical protein